MALLRARPYVTGCNRRVTNAGYLLWHLLRDPTNAMHNIQGTRLEAMLALLSPAVRHGTGPLARLMRDGALYCVFQPLADLREGSIYAHEALIRGPQDTPVSHP